MRVLVLLALLAAVAAGHKLCQCADDSCGCCEHVTWKKVEMFFLRDTPWALCDSSPVLSEACRP